MKTILAGTIALALAGAGLALAQSNSQSNAPSDTQSNSQSEQQSNSQSDRQSDSQSNWRGRRSDEGYRHSDEDVAAFNEARIAALKAGLRLTAEQEKNWPALETALRDLAKHRADRRKAREERWQARRDARDAGDDMARPDVAGRLRRTADRMTARANAVKQLADAVEPLYKTLDDGQKRRFAMLIHMGDRHGFRRHGRWRDRVDNDR